MMVNKILNLITFGLKPIYEKHLEYYKILKDFRDKLPRHQNEGRKITDEEKADKLILSSLTYLSVVDLSTQKISLTEADIDVFYNKLNNFDYNFMLFKSYYKKYTANLNRFNPKAKNKDFDLFMVQHILKENSIKPIKPFDVFTHNLKWFFKPTSKICVWIINRSSALFATK